MYISVLIGKDYIDGLKKDQFLIDGHYKMVNAKLCNGASKLIDVYNSPNQISSYCEHKSMLTANTFLKQVITSGLSISYTVRFVRFVCGPYSLHSFVVPICINQLLHHYDLNDVHYKGTNYLESRKITPNVHSKLGSFMVFQ